MKLAIKVLFLDEAGERFFGDGPERLLRAVEACGSVRAAAQSMGMAYTKALRLINHAEEALGFALITRAAGGKSGGGSRLTPQGAAWLRRYIAYREACAKAAERLYAEHFGDVTPE